MMPNIQATRITTNSMPYDEAIACASSDKNDTKLNERQQEQHLLSGDNLTLLEKPKRPLSAYNFFFRKERAALLGISEAEDETLFQPRDTLASQNKINDVPKRKHRKRPGMIGFKGLAAHCGKKWKELPSSEKEKYEMLFKRDQARYRREMELWRQQQRSKEDQEPAVSSSGNDHLGEKPKTRPSLWEPDGVAISNDCTELSKLLQGSNRKKRSVTSTSLPCSLMDLGEPGNDVPFQLQGENCPELVIGKSNSKFIDKNRDLDSACVTSRFNLEPTPIASMNPDISQLELEIRSFFR